MPKVKYKCWQLDLSISLLQFVGHSKLDNDKELLSPLSEPERFIHKGGDNMKI